MSIRAVAFATLRFTSVFYLAIAPAMAPAHPSAVDHMADYEMVFRDMEGDAFWDICRTISSDIDNSLPESFRKRFGPIPGNHRILGHSWALGDKMPKDVLRVLDNAYPGRKAEILRWWNEYADSEIAKIANRTGLSRAETKSLGNIACRIHLFGDRTPDNIAVDWVLPTRENAERLIRDLHDLFGRKSPELCRQAEKSIRKAMLLKTEPQRAEALLKACGEIDFSQMLERSYGPQLAPKGIHRVETPPGAPSPISNVKGVSPSSAARLQAKPNVVPANTPEGAKAWSGVRDKFQAKGKVQVRPGLLTADGRLLVSVESGAAAGFLVFAADAGTACYRYWQGDILDAEFAESIADAAIKGAVVGTAVAVAVMLGATPAGWCVLAVSTVAYIIVDIGLRIWREIDERRFLCEADLAAFGIRLDTTMSLRDSVLDMKEDAFSLHDSPLVWP